MEFDLWEKCGQPLLEDGIEVTDDTVYLAHAHFFQEADLNTSG